MRSEDPKLSRPCPAPNERYFSRRGMLYWNCMHKSIATRVKQHGAGGGETPFGFPGGERGGSSAMVVSFAVALKA